MKRFLYLVCLLIVNAAYGAIPMSRVIGINDSRTITVEANGVASTVVLKNVDLSPLEEDAARDYLHRQLDRAWVYIEDGDVYRSPDGLYINAELRRHAWMTSPGMRYLGELMLGPRPTRAEAPRAAIKRPTRSATVVLRSRHRRHARPR
jgi:hypothetical protein